MLSQEVNDYERSTAQYFNEISSYKSLSKEEERELFDAYKNNGDLNARDKILQANLKFVINVAKHYKGRGLSFADLVAEGNLGMARALDKFEPEREYKFISYAVWWIKQGILEAIQKRNNLQAEELPNDHNKEDSEDNEYNDIDDNDIYIDTFYDSQKDQDEKNAIIILSESLNEREKDILIEYFGLNGRKPKTLEEIGQKYNLTKERVRQINEKTLKKMRAQALNKCITSDIYR